MTLYLGLIIYYTSGIYIRSWVYNIIRHSRFTLAAYTLGGGVAVHQETITLYEGIYTKDL